jgi:hypothetical protein
MLTDEQQAVDITLGQPDGPGISVARRRAAGTGVMVSWPCAVILVPAFPRCNSSLDAPAWSHTHGM